MEDVGVAFLFSQGDSMLDTKHYEGEIAYWVGKFGFIAYNGNRRIFFSTYGTEEDWRGSRG